ncbi:MAG: exodeoxyribonuclease V subunit alpha [Solirubrobacteraceae bacterium]
MSDPATTRDPFDVRRARRAPGLLRDFNDAGVLAAADVHVALRLAGLGGESDESVILAAALAVRAPRLSHVFVDLATIRDTATVDADEPVDLSTLPWPTAAEWTERVAASGLVTCGEEVAAPSRRLDGGNASKGRLSPREDAAKPRPLRLIGTWLYLDRYWREERVLATDLRALCDQQPEGVRVTILADGLARLFAGERDGRQALAAATAVLRRLTVIAGGPGTGKTTILARVVALLAEQAVAAGSPAPLVALAAPTGKAAARLEEAVTEGASELDVSGPVRAQLLALRASTLHRLLGRRSGSHSRFRHDRSQRLAHDVVIVDEMSMVSLSMMARLVEAIRPDARLILVGDPGQLTSIEAGAVLRDIVGPAGDGPRIGSVARTLLAQATGYEMPAPDQLSGATVGAGSGAGATTQAAPGPTIGDGIVVLDRVHRFGGGIRRLAEAIRRGDADTVIEVLRQAPEGVSWIPVDAADPAAGTLLRDPAAHGDMTPPREVLAPVRERAVAAGRAVLDAARAGAASEAIAALGAFRILCAHRQGPHGVAAWTGQVEGWLARGVADFAPDGRWYAGRPLLVTENDHELRLYNGDTGVVVQSPLDIDRLSAAFERQGEIVHISPTRLAAVDTLYAMTIHKSQGSQFDTAVVLLPPPTSRILTRELLYTAATRARKLLILVGTEASIRAALARPVARASGLRWRLWGEEAPVAKCVGC